MMKYILRIITASVFLFIVTIPAEGQTVNELQARIKKYEQEIRTANELLKKTRNDQKSNESQLKLIRTRIKSRQDMIKSLEEQIVLIDNDILEKNNSIAELETELEKIKREYGEMVYAAYKNQKLNTFMAFLFAAEDFNQAAKRVEFMRLYNRSRKQKALDITAIKDTIAVSLEELDRMKEELDITRGSHSKELGELGKDETQYSRTVTQLRQQSTKLDKEVQAKQAEIDKAQKKIQELIAAEAKKNRNETRTVEEDRRVTELTGRFDQNMGKLPMPVRNGVIIDRYGTHDHATRRGVTIKNPGINIAAGKGAEVLCVFEGMVQLIFSVNNLNNCIMVRHGDYYTVYANLVTLSVKCGDKVDINQWLGRLPSTDDSDDHFLHFEVWKGEKNLNPESWLSR